MLFVLICAVMIEVERPLSKAELPFKILQCFQKFRWRSSDVLFGVYLEAELSDVIAKMRGFCRGNEPVQDFPFSSLDV